MGGCASRPKEVDLHPGSAPSEAPASPKAAKSETTPKETSNAGETKTEAPLGDLSEPKPETSVIDSSSAPKAAEIVDPVSTLVLDATTNPTEEKLVEELEAEVEPVLQTVVKSDVSAASTAVESDAVPSARTVTADAVPSSENKSEHHL